MKTHTIRLSAAWQILSQGSEESVVLRRFNAPTGIGRDQQILLHLRCEPGVACRAVELNGASIGGSFSADYRVEVIGKLQLSNVLQMTLSGSEIANYLGRANSRLVDISPLCQVELEIVGE